MSLRPEIRQGMDLELNWELSPFMMAEGVEVLKNAKVETIETRRDLEEDYKEVRGTLIRDGYAFIGAMGRSNAGKGSLLMGFSRLFRRDEYLKRILAKKGVELEIMAFPFAHAARAAMLPEVGIVPQGVKFAEFSPELTRDISKFQWNTMTGISLPQGAKYKKDVVAYMKKQKKARVVLFESSSPLVYPASSKVPVEVEGFDDNGNSTFYNAALDPRTKKNAFLYLIDRDEKMQGDEAVKFRRAVNTEGASIDSQDVRLLVTLHDGKEADFSSLSKEQQDQIKAVASISMAPPETMRRFDRTQDQLEQQLYEKGLIESPDDGSYYQFINDRLDGRIILIKNPYFSGPKTYDMEYLLGNPIVKAHPAILEKAA